MVIVVDPCNNMATVELPDGQRRKWLLHWVRPAIESPQIIIDWKDIIAAIDAQLERLGWNIDRARNYLVEQFGVGSRSQLDTEQIFEFLSQLRAMAL